MNTQRSIARGATLVATALAVLASPAAFGDEDTGLLGARWWQHAASIPAPQNPVVDETGAYCGIGQQGSAFFLHGSFGNPLGEPIERECTIPAGARIFIPVINWICIPFEGETIAQNIQICKDVNDMSDLRRLRIDGELRNELIVRRVSERAFALSLPDDNVFGLPTGVYQAVQDGYFAHLPLLEPGEHVIRVQGGLSAFGFTTDVRYRVHVVRPGKAAPVG
jgi:hypothetical protein